MHASNCWQLSRETGTPGTTGRHPTPTPAPRLACRDLYALVVYLHKNCNADLFAAMGALELTLTQIKLLHHLEGSTRELTLKEAAELRAALAAGRQPDGRRPRPARLRRSATRTPRTGG